MPIQDLQSIFQINITISEVIKNLLMAFIGGYSIALIYRWTYDGPGYSNRFLRSLITIAMITSIIILVIGNNLARAFGLVGAMSIIRFRTAVKDTHDIVFIFFTLAIGLSAGVGLHQITIIGVVLIGIVQIILYKIDFGIQKKQDYLLQITYLSNGDQDPEYLKIFNKYCISSKLINIRSLGREDMLELSFNLTLKNSSDSKILIKSLNNLSEIESVNLYTDERV